MYNFAKCLLGLLFIISQFATAQNSEHDIIRISAQLEFDTIKKQVIGNVRVKFKPLKNNSTFSLDAKTMQFSSVRLNDKLLPFTTDSLQLILNSQFKRDTVYELSFLYKAFPKKALYFLQRNSPKGKHQIWTQGQGQNTSNWLPSVDDVSEKIEFDISIIFNSNYTVIANGRLKTKTKLSGNKTRWDFDMNSPMSSYLVALAIGNYNYIQVYSDSGIPLQMLYYPEDSLKTEPTYRHTKTIVNFLEREIGYPYPWQNYKQAPVKDFLYAGMENTTATLFSDSYVIDSVAFKDQNYIQVNAHEFAHQWFGNLVTAKSSKHHWLQEGFSTYFAYQAEAHVLGSDYLAWQLYKSVLQLQNQNTTNKTTNLLNAKASSLTFYQHGGWVLRALKEEIGAEDFKTSIVKFLKRYAYKTATNTDFFKVVKEVSGNDLKAFKKTWVYTDLFPVDVALQYLFKTYPWLETYHKLDCKTAGCNYLLKDNNTHFRIKSKIINTKPELIKAFHFNTNNHEIQLALAQAFPDSIPLHLKPKYESLFFNSDSYLLTEILLYKLWANIPGSRNRYLNATSTITGFPSKNIRILWLGLALATKGYNPLLKPDYLNELINYTNPDYNPDVRESAFLMLKNLNAFNEESFNNLRQASTHHNWRFKRFARALLESIADTPN